MKRLNLLLLNSIFLLACNNQPNSPDNPSKESTENNSSSSGEEESQPESDKIGLTCNVDEDFAFCSGNNFIYCDDVENIWTKFTCPENFSCAEDETQALCLETCTENEEGQKDSICSSSMKVGTVCQKLPNGFFKVLDYNDSELCQDGCLNMKTCK